MGFSRQEYWSRLPFPSPEDLPDPGIEPRSPALHADSLLSEPLRKLGRGGGGRKNLCFMLKGWVLGQTMLAMRGPQFSVSLNIFLSSNIWRGKEISCHHTEASTAYHKNVAVLFHDTIKEKSSLEKWSVCPVLRLQSLLIWIWILTWPRIIQLPFKCC